MQAYGVAVDASGNVYFAGDNGVSVYKLTLSNGTFTQSQIATGLSKIPGLAADASGNVYVADAGGGSGGDVGTYKEALANGTYSQINLNSMPAYGVTVDASGNVYFAGDNGVSVYIIRAVAVPISRHYQGLTPRPKRWRSAMRRPAQPSITPPRTRQPRVRVFTVARLPSRLQKPSERQPPLAAMRPARWQAPPTPSICLKQPHQPSRRRQEPTVLHRPCQSLTRLPAQPSTTPPTVRAHHEFERLLGRDHCICFGNA